MSEFTIKTITAVETDKYVDLDYPKGNLTAPSEGWVQSCEHNTGMVSYWISPAR